MDPFPKTPSTQAIPTLGSGLITLGPNMVYTGVSGLLGAPELESASRSGLADAPHAARPRLRDPGGPLPLPPRIPQAPRIP